MALRSSTSSSSNRSIATRHTNASSRSLSLSPSFSTQSSPLLQSKSSSSSSPSPAPLSILSPPVIMVSDISPLKLASSSSTATTITTTTTTATAPAAPILSSQADSDTSSNSSLKRRRGRPSKKSQSSDHYKKQHLSLSATTSLQQQQQQQQKGSNGMDTRRELKKTTSKLCQLKLLQPSMKEKAYFSATAIQSKLSLKPTADTLHMGDQVDAWKEDQQDYFRARVVEMDGLLVFVHYEGFSPDQADWVNISELRVIDHHQRKQRTKQYKRPSTKPNPVTKKRASSRINLQQPLDDDNIEIIERKHNHNNNNAGGDYYDDHDDDDDDDDDVDMEMNTNDHGNYGPRGRESRLSWQDYATFYYSEDGYQARRHTGLVQDRRMSLHCCPCHSEKFIHPERPDRLSSIIQQLHNDRILRFVKHLHGREATTTELLRAHTSQHVRNYTPEDENAIKVTSIAALLNPVVSPPPSPTTNGSHYDDTNDEALPTALWGIGGGVVMETNQGRLLRHRQRQQLATTIKQELCSDDTKMTYPPDLLCQMTCGELGISVDTTFHPAFSSISAKVAAGSLIALVDDIVQGKLRNGFALIRPPGHHAEESAAMGFCFYNNVAVAALSTLKKHAGLIKKILIIDWDVHHGNGTQKIFYENPNVLYISVHRWDHGQFYPYSGSPEECGLGDGLGKNVNIALSDAEGQTRPMGDPEFIAALYHLVVPIARQFQPDMIFVSAGFDAAEGHPENLGGYKVTPRGYAIMTKIVKDLAEELCKGRLVLTLEGGYALQPLAVSAAASVTQLLPPSATLATDYLHDYRHTLNTVKPNQGCVASLAECAKVQQSYWQLPKYVISPTCRFQLPLDWRATDGILTRPKREKRPVKTPIVEGY